jgi:8-oxo-dGTP pyrophosphatase MutT (NUDIX family)
MPTPPYIVELRRKVGHDLLLLPGLVAVVVDGAGRVLLNRRVDTRDWSLISGILEPGEQPAEALEREVFEETGVRVRAAGVLDAWTSPVITYPNGDRAQYLTVAYRCEVVGGEPRVNDDESLEVRFFAPGEVPALRGDLIRCVELALRGPR